MNIQRARTVCTVMLTALLLGPEAAVAGIPTDQIRATVERVLSILKDPKLKLDDATNERRAELRAAIFPRFDFEEMAKRSLGAEWRRRTPDEQSEFVRVFTELLKDSYITSIDSYRGERVIYNRESVDGGYAEVGTAIVTDQGEQFMIDYRLSLAGRDWKVYDVVIENISIVNNYRSQFRRILGKSSFAELLRLIRDKIN